MYITIITDCADTNARGRQETRIQALFDHAMTFVSIPGTLDLAATLEASGNIIDILDAAGGAPGVVLANVAPRSGEEKRWGNGTPFCLFRYRETVVFATVTGYTLSLPKKLGLTERVELIDLPGTLSRVRAEGTLSPEEEHYIQHSQFRSYDFLPRAARWLTEGRELVTTPYDVGAVPDVPASVWAVDNFGNVKTTLLASELPRAATLATRFGAIPIVPSLKDVPDGTVAATVGSSGIGTERFVELACQGSSAASALGAAVGNTLF
jgi:hypothetical protein